MLVVQMPSGAVRDPLLRRAARRDGRAAAPTPTVAGNGATGSALLRKVGVRMLVIDELHSVLAGNSVNRREFSTCCASSATNCASCWLGRHARRLPSHPPDDQLENRFEPMMPPVWGGQRRLLLTAGQLRRFRPAAPAFPNSPRWTWLATCSHAARGHHRGTGALADGGGHRRRGERRGSDQPSHTQHGLLSCI